MKPRQAVRIEVLAYAPVAFFHCQHCEVIGQVTGTTTNIRREQLASSLPQDLTEEYLEVSNWVRGLMLTYGESIDVRVVDVASIEGWFKSLRYGIRKYPAVVVDGKQKIIGRDFDRASALIDERVARGRSACSGLQIPERSRAKGGLR